MDGKRTDRRAWIRILEVFLAILIILGSMLVVINKNAPERDISEEVYGKQRQILEIISKDDELRKDIIVGNNLNVNNTIITLIPKSWEFSTNICSLNEACPNLAGYQEIGSKNVYATEVIVTSNLTYYNPKKLRFFVWMR